MRFLLRALRMNYYEHHLGDYAKDTAHLTMLEHGAYRLLLDRYYGTEAGIPADQAHRVARARSRDEKVAVDTVLGEFFTLTDGVWINKRADEEIVKAQAKITTAKENGKKGGRPKKQTNGHEVKTQEKPSGFPVGYENETQQKAHQSPVTSHQTPDVNPSEQSSSHSQPVDVTTSCRDRPEIPDPPTAEAHWLTWLNREAGTQFEAGSRFDRKDLWPIFRRWCEAGITQQQVMDAIRTAQANAREPIANLPKYIDRVLANSQAPIKTSPADSAKLAAARAIFGTEIEGDNHGQSARVIDAERTTPALRG